MGAAAPDPRREEIELGQLLTFTACIRGNAPAFVRGEPVALDPASLRIAGRRVSWIAGGEPRSAVVR